MKNQPRQLILPANLVQLTIPYTQYETPASFGAGVSGDKVDKSMFVGNVLQNLKYEFNLASHKLDLFDNNKLRADNASQLLNFKDNATDEKDMFGRIIGVLELLV